MNYTTLNEILMFGPCGQKPGSGWGWNKLLASLGKKEADDEPLPYSKILEINGIDDAIWSLRTNRKLAQAYAIACAESVLPIFEKRHPGDTRVSECIEATKGYIAGGVSFDELRLKRFAAADAAAAAYTAAAAYAAYAAYTAANAAAYAAADAADYGAYTAAAAYAAYAAADADRQAFKAKIFLEIVGA